LLIFGLINVSNGAALNVHSKNVGIEMAIPRGYTREQYVKSIVDFWTPERMASAIPLQPIITKSYMIPFSGNNQNNEPERILTPSTYVRGVCSKNPPAAGRAFFVFNTQTYVCSGSVVNAKNRDMVITAGHCVYNTTSKQYATNWIFVPGYNNDERPDGTFVWRYIETNAEWRNKADYNYDVAVVLMNENEQKQHIQDAAGIAFGITLNAAKKVATNAFGFPMNMNNGETMSTCAAVSTNPTLFLMSSFKGLQISCGMGGGASGGPWCQSYNSNTCTCQQVSVTSFSYALAQGKIHGPHFNDANIGKMFRECENK